MCMWRATKNCHLSWSFFLNIFFSYIEKTLNMIKNKSNWWPTKKIIIIVIKQFCVEADSNIKCRRKTQTICASFCNKTTVHRKKVFLLCIFFSPILCLCAVCCLCFRLISGCLLSLFSHFFLRSSFLLIKQNYLRRVYCSVGSHICMHHARPKYLW